MVFKGINKIYFGLGVEDDYFSFDYKCFFFYWFKLKRKNLERETLKFGRDYLGCNLRIRFKSNFGIRF